MVIWIIGLSGSGKTAVSKLVYNQLKPSVPNLVRLDGDVIRALFNNDVGHSVADRRRNADRLSNLSKFLAGQKIHIIASVLSIFPEWRQWNRINIPDYAEVYLKVSLKTVQKRDKNNLYSPALKGKLKNVVGVDIPFPEPKNPDLVIDNNNEKEDLRELANQIISLSVVQKVIGVKK